MAELCSYCVEFNRIGVRAFKHEDPQNTPLNETAGYGGLAARVRANERPVDRTIGNVSTSTGWATRRRRCPRFGNAICWFFSFRLFHTRCWPSTRPA